MHRLVPPSRTLLVLAVVIIYASTYAGAGTNAATPVEQPAAAHVRVADDPTCLEQRGSVSAWMEGQITYRSLPGIVVGVERSGARLGQGVRLRGHGSPQTDDHRDEVPDGIA